MESDEFHNFKAPFISKTKIQEAVDEFRSKYEYLSKYEISNSINKFYIVANDREEMIISTVLHTLAHTRIINNNELNDEIISRFKKYANDIGFKICEDKTPPTPPTPPNPIESSSKNEDIKSNEPVNDFTKEKEKASSFGISL